MGLSDHLLMNPMLPPNLSQSHYLRRYLSALSSCYAAQGLQLIAFERYLSLRKSSAGGNHAHINAIGVPSAAVKGSKEAFSKVR